MAVKVLPTIQTIFSGEGITPEINTVRFEVGEKIENSWYVKEGENFVVDFEKVSNIKTINFYSDSPYVVNLKVDVGDEETPNEVDVPLSITGSFRLDPSQIFLSTLKEIKITTESIEDVLIVVKVYGAK